MTVVLAFGIAQLLTTIYAFWRGGTPERGVASMLLAATAASWLVPVENTSFDTVLWPMLWIDVALLLGLTVVAALADRFWPTWIAACQVITLAGHGARAYEPGLHAAAYWAIIGSTAYPILCILTMGVWRHHQRRLRGYEFGWTMQRHRYECTAVQNARSL